MKKFESVEELQVWEDYREFTKVTFKLLDGEAPFFVSKDKLEFDIDGKVWKGHALLAGKKAEIAVKSLKKSGVIFREGVCTRSGKELEVSDLKPAKLRKEAEKTLKKMRLGYSIAGADAEDDTEDDAPGGPQAAAASATQGTAPGKRPMSAEVRSRKVAELKKMEADIDRLLAALNQ